MRRRVSDVGEIPGVHPDHTRRLTSICGPRRDREWCSASDHVCSGLRTRPGTRVDERAVRRVLPQMLVRRELVTGGNGHITRTPPRNPGRTRGGDVQGGAPGDLVHAPVIGVRDEGAVRRVLAQMLVRGELIARGHRHITRTPPGNFGRVSGRDVQGCTPGDLVHAPVIGVRDEGTVRRVLPQVIQVREVVVVHVDNRPGGQPRHFGRVPIGDVQRCTARDFVDHPI